MAIDLIVPALGESISEAVVAKWLKNIGEPVALDEPVAELETDKVTVELPAPAAGVLSGHRVAAGETVRVGDSIGTIEAGAQAAQPAKAEAAPTAQAGNGAAKAPAPQAVAPPAQVAPVPTAQPVEAAAPAAAAQGRPLPPSQRRAILEGHAVVPAASYAPAPTPTAAKAPRPIVPRDDEEVVQMSPLRRTIAARLVEAQHTAAILTTFNEVDMSAIMELRSRFQEGFVAKHGLKLGFMSFFAKACVEALKEYPGLNAELHDTSIIYKKHYDLGIAVGGGKGLVVPVIRAVDRMSFAEIEQTVADLGQRARSNRLTLDELSGGTFSITNGGIYGSMMSTPLLNMPQTGILGMHNIVRRPVVVGSGAGERIEIRPMMYLALSYDHRVVDGREAVQFLVAVKQRLEAPERMLFSV